MTGGEAAGGGGGGLNVLGESWVIPKLLLQSHVLVGSHLFVSGKETKKKSMN